MIIPHDQLAPETLTRLIEEFVTRDGTELTDATVKIERVRSMLARGRAQIYFDEDEGTCNILKVE